MEVVHEVLHQMHVEITNIVRHVQVVVQMLQVDIIRHRINVVRRHVQMHQRMRNIQVMERHDEIIVVGDVSQDIIWKEVNVKHVHDYEVIIQVQDEMDDHRNVIYHVEHDII